MGHGLLHHACRLHDLRQEHLALAEQVADNVHADHQRAFDDVQRPPALRPDALVDLFGVFDDEVVDAVHQRMREPLVDRFGAPRELGAVVLGRALGALGDLDEALAGVAAPVQHDVLDPFAQLRLEIVVDADHAGVDDAHVHAGLDRVVQEHGVDRLAHRVVAAEAEAHIADAAADLRARQVLLDPARRVDEVDRVVVVLFDTRGNREDVRIEDDVFRREADFVDEDAVSALADLGLALVGVGLAFFVEGHHDCGRAVAAHEFRLMRERGDAFLQRDRVDDALALDALEAGFDDLPLRAVDHDRHARDLRLAGNQMQEAHHRGLAVEHGLVHVDVDDLRAVFDLLARDGERLLELAVEDQTRERFRSGDVGALADVDEQAALADRHGLEPRQFHRWHRCGFDSSSSVVHGKAQDCTGRSAHAARFKLPVERPKSRSTRPLAEISPVPARARLSRSWSSRPS